VCFAEVFVKFWVFQPNRETDNNALRLLSKRLYCKERIKVDTPLTN
jgi:hypothetical protein